MRRTFCGQSKGVPSEAGETGESGSTALLHVLTFLSLAPWELRTSSLHAFPCSCSTHWPVSIFKINVVPYTCFSFIHNFCYKHSFERFQRHNKLIVRAEMIPDICAPLRGRGHARPRNSFPIVLFLLLCSDAIASCVRSCVCAAWALWCQHVRGSKCRVLGSPCGIITVLTLVWWW